MTDKPKVKVKQGPAKPAASIQAVAKINPRSTKMSIPRVAMKPGFAKRKG